MPRRKMSVMQLTLLTSLSMMGAGIIMLPAKFAEIGAISMLSWIVTALASGAVAYVFAQCGMLSKKLGGLGGFAEYAFGEPGAFIVNYAYAISLVFGNIAISLAAVSYGLSWFHLPFSSVFACVGLRAPFMDRITSHLPLPVHHRPHHRHLRLGALAAFDYACRCGRLLV